jgi:imidazolonepropionase-like amidohydrolase
MATAARSVEREDPEPAQMMLEEVAAVVEEAHRLGYRVAAHAEGLAGARNAIEAGRRHDRARPLAPPRARAARRDGRALDRARADALDVPRPGRAVRERLRAALVEQAKRQAEEAARTLNAAAEAGVILAMGYDSGPPGASANELVRMAEAGLGTAAAIRAATAGSPVRSVLTGRRHDRGPEGRDLLVVDGDPLAAPSILLEPDRVRLVLQAGRVVAGTRPEPTDIRP